MVSIYNEINLTIEIVKIGLNKFTLVQKNYFLSSIIKGKKSKNKIMRKLRYEEIVLKHNLKFGSKYNAFLSKNFNAKYNTKRKIMVLDYDNAVKAKEYFESLLLMNKLKKDF